MIKVINKNEHVTAHLQTAEAENFELVSAADSKEVSLRYDGLHLCFCSKERAGRIIEKITQMFSEGAFTELVIDDVE